MQYQVIGYDLAWNHPQRSGRFLLHLQGAPDYPGSVATPEEFAVVVAMLGASRPIFIDPASGVLSTA